MISSLSYPPSKLVIVFLYCGGGHQCNKQKHLCFLIPKLVSFFKKKKKCIPYRGNK